MQRVAGEHGVILGVGGGGVESRGEWEKEGNEWNKEDWGGQGHECAAGPTEVIRAELNVHRQTCSA